MRHRASASGPSATVNASASAPAAKRAAAPVASSSALGAVQPRRRASAKTPTTLIQSPAAVASAKPGAPKRPKQRDLEGHIDCNADERDPERRRCVAARQEARRDDSVNQQSRHADRVGREHPGGLLGRIGLEGAVLEGDRDDEVRNEKKRHDERSAERDRQRSGSVLGGDRATSSPRATSADISLSSTEPVAITMTPPGN